MKVEPLPNGRNKFTIRQSWYSDFIACHEKARQKAFELPQIETNSDATAIGTAVHHHIEERLRGVGALETDPWSVFDSIMADPNSEWVQIKTRKTAHEKITNCVEYFEHDTWEKLQAYDVVALEHTFNLLFDQTPDGDQIWLTGTMDAVIGEAIVDWKTTNGYLAADKYNAGKARFEVQPTVYTWAANQVGLLTDVPAKFLYVVFDKQGKLDEPLEVWTERTEKDWEGLRHELRSVVDMWYTYEEGKRWPLKTSHYLCSEKWCEAWASCEAGGGG